MPAYFHKWPTTFCKSLITEKGSYSEKACRWLTDNNCQTQSLCTANNVISEFNLATTKRQDLII